MIEIKDRFPIENPHAVSVRIFFCKQDKLDTVWHLADASLGYVQPGGRGVKYMALHGQKIYAGVRCDSVTQAELARMPGEYFCEHCLDEFNLALDIIKQKELLKF